MKHRDWKRLVEDMLSHVDKAIAFTKGYSPEQFASDAKTQHAVMHCIEIIGEAANGLPDDFYSRHPDIPWREIIAMRNVLIHHYYDVDHARVWQTIQRSLPELRLQLIRLLND